MESLFFSVIMPVYNVEEYLEAAVNSVLQQTYPHFELILVEDRATDGSAALCDRLAANDKRVRVIHKPHNEGLSMARNSGIDVAAGDYIYFIDSDDTIDLNLFEQVAESLQAHPAHAVMFGVREEYFDSEGSVKETFDICYEKKVLADHQALRKEVIDLEYSTLFGYANNKFYHHDFLKRSGVRFTHITLIEDVLFNVQFFKEAETLNILDTVPYHYNKRLSGSLTARFVPEYFELHQQRLELFKEQYIYWNLYDDRVRAILGTIFCRYIFSGLQRNYDKRANMNGSQRKAWVKALFKDEFFNDVIPHAHGKSTVVNILLKFLKSKNVQLTLLSSRFIYIIKNQFPLVFASVKQNR